MYNGRRFYTGLRLDIDLGCGLLHLHRMITYTKAVMFLCRFIGLMVCLLTRILKNVADEFFIFKKLEKVGIKSCQMVGVI